MKTILDINKFLEVNGLTDFKLESRVYDGYYILRSPQGHEMMIPKDDFTTVYFKLTLFGKKISLKRPVDSGLAIWPEMTKNFDFCFNFEDVSSEEIENNKFLLMAIGAFNIIIDSKSIPYPDKGDKLYFCNNIPSGLNISNYAEFIHELYEIRLSIDRLKDKIFNV